MNQLLFIVKVKYHKTATKNSNSNVIKFQPGLGGRGCPTNISCISEYQEFEKGYIYYHITEMGGYQITKLGCFPEAFVSYQKYEVTKQLKGVVNYQKYEVRK